MATIHQPNLFRAFRAYKSACDALTDHTSSSFAQMKRDRSIIDRYQTYLDLDHWPASPALKGMTVVIAAELRVWGDEFTITLNDFHERTKALEGDRLAALHTALQALGVHAGQDFLKSVGTLSRRIAKATLNAGCVRYNMLDGHRYLSIFEENSYFAKGFFMVTGLKQSALRSELMPQPSFAATRF